MLQPRGYFCIPSFTTFWSWSIAWWKSSGCFCSCFPASAHSSYWVGFWHCRRPWCMEAIAVTSVIKNGIFPTYITTYSWVCVCSCFIFQFIKTHKSQKVISKYFICRSRIFSKYPYSAVNFILCSHSPTCYGRGTCIGGCSA